MATNLISDLEKNAGYVYTQESARCRYENQQNCSKCKKPFVPGEDIYLGVDSSNTHQHTCGECSADFVELFTKGPYEPLPYKIPEKTTSLWRYMDFVKYVSLLSTAKLYFSGSAGFDDPFEGAMGIKGTEVNWEQIIKANYRAFITANPAHANTTPDEVEQIVEGNFFMHRYGVELMRKVTYISCWHANEFESEAMWKLYSKDNNNAIAIKTNYQRLYESLGRNTNIEIGNVNYVDYRFISPSPNYLFWYKRKSYEHEKEVRAVCQNLDAPDDPEVIRAADYLPPRGISHEVNLSILIEKIYVSPLAGDWLIELVRDVSSKYNINVEVVKSDLAQLPY